MNDYQIRYERWAQCRRNDPEAAADAACAAIALHVIRERPALSVPIEGSKRGRPAIHYHNPVFRYMGKCITAEDPPWLESIIYGSIATAVGSASGRLRARLSDVRHALTLPVICVLSIEHPYMSRRTAQDIARAARHAAHGINSYLQVRPNEMKRLRDQAWVDTFEVCAT